VSRGRRYRDGHAALGLTFFDSDAVILKYKVHFLRHAASERRLAERMVLRAGRSVTIPRADMFIEEPSRRSLCAARQQRIMRAPLLST